MLPEFQSDTRPTPLYSVKDDPALRRSRGSARLGSGHRDALEAIAALRGLSGRTADRRFPLVGPRGSPA